MENMNTINESITTNTSTEYIQCEYCQKRILSSQIFLHTPYCSSFNMKCSLCNECFPKEELEQHNLDYHSLKENHELENNQDSNFYKDDGFIKENEMKQCKYCTLLLHHDEVLSHEENCGAMTYECDKCHTLILIKNQQNHYKTCLPETKLKDYITIESTKETKLKNKLMKKEKKLSKTEKTFNNFKEQGLVEKENNHDNKESEIFNYNEYLQNIVYKYDSSYNKKLQEKYKTIKNEILKNKELLKKERQDFHKNNNNEFIMEEIEEVNTINTNKSTKTSMNTQNMLNNIKNIKKNKVILIKEPEIKSYKDNTVTQQKKEKNITNTLEYHEEKEKNRNHKAVKNEKSKKDQEEVWKNSKKIRKTNII